ncbi:MAG: CHAT domain-containing protein, partial [Actinomycetota bacterium]|nr:CHAT domain-containing protein [Actinomycetota bacterium]
RRAVGIAERHGLATRAAEARLNLSGALALRGDSSGALREADRAVGALRGHDRNLLELQRACLLHVNGRLSEALEGYRRVLPALRRAQDRSHEATALHNRASIEFHFGALGAAEADLVRAEQLYVALGHGRDVADVRQNLALIAARRGDVPTALAWFDRVDEYFRNHGIVDGAGFRERCDTLLAARLVAEARQTADDAVRALASQGMGAFLAEARLMLSEVALLQGDVMTARSEAEKARRAFTRQGRQSFLALARHALVRARWAAGESSPALLGAARKTADALEAAGWAASALDARLVAGRIALDTNRLDVARTELAKASRARRRGPVALRSRAWHAEALLRLAAGNHRGAESALRAGMRLLEHHRAAMGATELRAQASGHGTELAGLGLRLALADGKAERVLAWAERWRAGSLQLRPVRPPDDAALRDELAELRGVVTEVHDAALEGRDTRRLLARQTALEESVRRRSRHAPGLGTYHFPPAPTAAALQEALGERALVELVEVEGALHAAVVADGSPTLRALGPLEEVVAELDSLRFALRRLSGGYRSAAALAAAGDALSYAAGRLDDLLLAPLGDAIGARPLVVVPTGALHALPWSVLPSCTGRALAVSPSASLWYRAAAAQQVSPASYDRVVLVAGPELPGAVTEVSELRGRYPDARSLLGHDAAVEAVASALDGADLAHVAAHGYFRADNPLFSSLRFADGPLTVYDLEALDQAPRCLVLSACDSGLSGVRPGDELMGLAAALFALGTRSLVASVAPVPDAAVAQLMVAFHEALREGSTPADALVRAQAGCSGSPESRAAAASFVCFGAG